MRVALVVIVTIFFSMISHAQVPDYRVLHLVSKILEKLPDAGYTRVALGDTDEREKRAEEHALAIVAASDQYKDKWQQFAKDGKWRGFNAERDLPALIAAMAMHESSFRSVIRLDDNTILTTPRSRMPRADCGVLQVRAPSAPAANCGVKTKEDVHRLVNDLEFAYTTGTCVLTNRIAHYVVKYTSPAFKRFNRLERPDLDGPFYGFVGSRRNTAESRLARDLIVIERYNWGSSDLYLHPLHGGYARRILRMFEYFKIPGTESST